MWGNLLNVIPNNEGKANSYTKAGHSVGCRMLGTDVLLMIDLDFMLQEHVIDCPHASHESVKMLFRFQCDSERSTEIEEGKLF